MWLEIDVMIQDTGINWKALGLDVKHEFARRMILLEDIKYLQELTHDIQILVFNDTSSVYVKGQYVDIRDNLLHLQAEQDEQDYKGI